MMSIIIPAYESGQTIAATLDSVRSRTFRDIGCDSQADLIYHDVVFIAQDGRAGETPAVRHLRILAAGPCKTTRIHFRGLRSRPKQQAGSPE
jgi:hypothetical protein